MARFEKGNKQGRGRPLGSRNKRTQLSPTLTALAIKNLTEAAKAGESWATIEIMKRTVPCLRPSTPENTLDGALIELKIKELESFEQRLVVLEEQQN